jgi:hypothetical protein
VSILLSAYFPEGIVFAADKNVTMLYSLRGGVAQEVEVGIATKVIPWANRRAVVGFAGLGQLAGLPMWEWMRQFAAQTRDFEDLTVLARDLREAIQRDFGQDHSDTVDTELPGLIVHLGGFKRQSGVVVPAMYYIANVRGFDECGKYESARRNFNEPSDELAPALARVGVDEFRGWLEQKYRRGGLLWFNNGLYFQAFNALKSALWQALTAIRTSPCNFLALNPTLDDRIAYCRMAVELFGSFFQHHFVPSHRGVGGGVDVEWVVWPEV